MIVLSNHTPASELKEDFCSLKTLDQSTLSTRSYSEEELVRFIKTTLLGLSGYYPLFDNWLESKVIPGLLIGERKIVLEHHRGQFAGLAIVKDDGLEQKLCCLRVLPKYQGTGSGLKLFERSFEILQNQAPLLSIAEEQADTFRKIFNYYGFELAKKYHNYYRPLKDELSFNGLIDNNYRPPAARRNR
ncbi:GNAT family N-acetyltransferase [Pseudomonas putida]|uniref:GNAT family N-acetyltransferase n=1 Tax=Pseudomonas putida TaxID=303 RepID=UPI00215649B3|nr:GNAT family N-acetyltransferase [Pseudomonas putida]